MNDSRTPNPNAVAALERILREIQYLTEHPRIQQRTWVARGKEWLPLLQIVHSELTGQPATLSTVTPPENEDTMLIKVSMSADETYMQIKLDEIDRIQVNRGRGSSNITLKNGKQYILNADEAQRVVSTMRKRDDEAREN